MNSDEYQKGTRRTRSSELDTLEGALRWMIEDEREADIIIKALPISVRQLRINKLRQLVMILGLVGEAGELADYAKKVLVHGHDGGTLGSNDAAYTLSEEAGDVEYYLTSIEDEAKMNKSDVLAANNHKLWVRFPDGFSKAASIARADRKEAKS